MELQEIIGELERAGVTVAVEGKNLKLRVPATYYLPPEYVAELRQHRGEALAYLKGRGAAGSSSAVSKDHIRCETEKLKILKAQRPESSSAVPQPLIPCETAKLKTGMPEAPCESIRAGEKESAHPYEARLRAVLLQTCRPEYPAGMVPWLEISDPGLYDDLTRRLPELVHELWTAHAPLEEFQHVVDAWLDTHRRACERYKTEKVR